MEVKKSINKFNKEYYKKYYLDNKHKINKEERKEYLKKYYRDNKDKIEAKINREEKRKYLRKYYRINRKILNVKSRLYHQRNKDKIGSYGRAYSNKWGREYYHKNRKKILKRQKIYRREYLNKNPSAKISSRLRNLINKALKVYTKTGKYQSSKKYGINYEEIINHLKPFPKDLSKYHIDHIKPLHSFNLTNSEEIKKAFVPENHQWLLARDNLIKGGRY